MAAIAATEPLTPPPSVPYPVTVTETRTVSRQALVAYRGNRYSVPPELAAAQVTVTRRLGDEVIDIVTASHITVARHRLAPDGAGALVRDHGHVHALDQTAMSAAMAGGRPHRRKERIPPGPDALTAAAALRTDTTDRQLSSTTPRSTVVDLAAYERAARGRNTLA
ncbi:Mu transposase domain-containing protein [Rhodococcus rhodochrous]|uniref:Mu transposase domain-containing protein n=1 Tax=Rhodococcus rhodochrous TaxID=1829 RepID=UPI00384E27FF